MSYPRYVNVSLSSNYTPKTLSSSPASIAQAREIIGAEGQRPLNYLDGYQSEATVGVLDLYSRFEDDVPSHGEKVYSILARSGFEEAEIQKIDNSSSSSSYAALTDLIFKDGSESFRERTEAYIELSASQVLAKTNGTLKQLVQDPNLKLKTLNQSQGSSRSGAYSLLSAPAFVTEDKVRTLSPFGERLAELYEMPQGDPAERVKSLEQHMIDHVDKVVTESSFLGALQQEHISLVDQLRERGVLMVTSAGNDADECQALVDKGLRVPEDFDDDVTAVGKKLVVGAMDTKGTPEVEDDEVAFFSSRYPGVNVYAQGVNVDTLSGPATGTSFASPLVTAKAEHLRREHPDWSVDSLQEAIIAKP